MSQIFAHLDADGFVVGFYSDEFHSPEMIPVGAVPIDDEHHTMLLEGQSVGKRMKLSAVGLPLLVDSAPPTDDRLATQVRARRDAMLDATDWIVSRHQEESIAGGAHTLTVEQCAALICYRKDLRDLPSAPGFPNVALPVAPDFIGVQ
jgi:hypothetical protein